jgi:hypothetical protein
MLTVNLVPMRNEQSCQQSDQLRARWMGFESHMETGYNTSTIALQVTEGAKKGTWCQKV